MAKTRRGFRCSACGAESAAFAGRCHGCSAWNTLEPFEVADVPPRAASATTLIRLADVDHEEAGRAATGIPEFDRVLGGGLVRGSLVLVGGEPGIGKSTLMLQAAGGLGLRGVQVVYVCGEESARQVKSRAGRLGIDGDRISLVVEPELDAALEAAKGALPEVVIVDSIQSMRVAGVDTRAGGPAQLAEAGARLLTWAKQNEITVILTGHVTKTGDIAGPRLLEHLVDAVLYFESGEGGEVRILRAVKNRFGATDEVGVFEMTGSGLASIENPSLAFLDPGGRIESGCAVTATMEGSRAIVVEVQALAVESHLAAPRRVASGIETSRLHLLLAVLARRGGLNAGSMDVVATVSGGLRLRDPGADLAVVAALASAIANRPLPPSTAFVGEVALSGTVRAPQQMPRRIAELGRMGFDRVIGPPVEGRGEVAAVRSVREVVRTILGSQAEGAETASAM